MCGDENIEEFLFWNSKIWFHFFKSWLLGVLSLFLGELTHSTDEPKLSRLEEFQNPFFQDFYAKENLLTLLFWRIFSQDLYLLLSPKKSLKSLSFGSKCRILFQKRFWGFLQKGCISKSCQPIWERSLKNLARCFIADKN